MNSEPPQEEPISLLSVIVPVYNAEPFLPRCLESLIHQTYRNLEIICVNDGSTDGSAAILDEYAAKDSRIKVIHQKNAGVAVARNRGLDAATGEFLTFVDADDWVEHWGYGLVMSRFSDETDVLCFGARVDDVSGKEEQGGMADYLRLPFDGTLSVCELAKLNINACIWCKMWRRDLVESLSLRFIEGMRYSEDECFFYCSLSGVRKLIFIQDKLYHYVQHAQSAMRNKEQLRHRVQDTLKGTWCLLAFYREKGVYENLKQAFLEHFQHCFDCIEKHAEPDMFSLYYQEMHKMLLDGNLGDCREKSSVRAILNHQMGRVARLFCRFKTNRLCVGVGKFVAYSITYEIDRTVYRLFGRVVWVSLRG